MSSSNFSRRGMIATLGAGAGLVAPLMEAQSAVAAPVRKLRQEAGKVTIKAVTTFDVLIPQPPGAQPPTFLGGTPGRLNVTCVETNAGIRG